MLALRPAQMAPLAINASIEVDELVDRAPLFAPRG
jgi:hypothetical protein